MSARDPDRTPDDPPATTGERVEGAVLDLTDGAPSLDTPVETGPAGASLGTVERIIDLRAPGAPYTYPSSPAAETAADAEPAGSRPASEARSSRDRISVAIGSADVPTAPPGT